MAQHDNSDKMRNRADTGIVPEGTLLWEPGREVRDSANISRYLTWLEKNKGLRFEGYSALWDWSAKEIEAFWESLWGFFAIKASRSYTNVLTERKMPGARWFTGAKLNFAEHVFRHMTSDRPALKFQSEIKPYVEISWSELYRNVSAVAAALRSLGVKPGDRVVAYMPNIPETTTAFLACVSLGAVWSSCSPDFGTRSVNDRFKQIEPKVLFAVDGYQYGGKAFDCRPAVAELQGTLTSLERIVLVPYLSPDVEPEGLKNALLWDELLHQSGELVFHQAPFEHPLWVVYSSGTTGPPKGLVHSQGGILLEFLKFLHLHLDLNPGETFFWFSTTGWVMWNILHGSLLTGAIPLLYDGSPGYPDTHLLWDLAEKARMTVFGTSAAYITACMNQGLEPGKKYNLDSLKTIGSTGSPLSPEGFQWVYKKVKKDLLLGSVSGGTDPCTAFLGCCPLLPVRAGELQCRCLGVKAQAYDENGRPVVDQVGELVISEPMPSMPLYLWNDPDNRRYIESYFDLYPGVWSHRDWVRITPGGSGVILGRSDSTINRYGVRMGSSEIYNVVEEIPGIQDSLVIGFEAPDGRYLMPLFVVLGEDATLDDRLKETIKSTIRHKLSPRHVPDDIYSIPEVPKTLNAKKLEVPVKKILSGIPLEDAVNIDSMSNPEAIGFFVTLARELWA